MPKPNGPLIRRVREEADLSAAEVAEKVNRAEGTVRSWENGRAEYISRRAAIKLGRVLNVPADDLLIEDERVAS